MYCRKYLQIAKRIGGDKLSCSWYLTILKMWVLYGTFLKHILQVTYFSKRKYLSELNNSEKICKGESYQLFHQQNSAPHCSTHPIWFSFYSILMMTGTTFWGSIWGLSPSCISRHWIWSLVLNLLIYLLKKSSILVDLLHILLFWISPFWSSDISTSKLHKDQANWGF